MQRFPQLSLVELSQSTLRLRLYGVGGARGCWMDVSAIGATNLCRMSGPGCRAKPRAAKKRMTQQLLKHDRPHRQPTNDGEDLQVQGPVPPDPLVRARQLRMTSIHIRTRRLDVVVEALDDFRLLRY